MAEPRGRLSPANATATPTPTPSATPPATPTVPPAPSGQIWRSYYFAGAQRIAVRVQGDPVPANNGVFYLLGDHLGSTNVVVDPGGNLVSELRYKPWGETMYASGTSPTDYRYTGQREEAGIGLYYYRARWYDPSLGRFVQADTVTAGLRPAAWDRYSYVLNNPVRHIDPTGHMCSDPEDPTPECDGGLQWKPARLAGQPRYIAFIRKGPPTPRPPSRSPVLGERLLETAVTYDKAALAVSAVGALFTWGTTLGGAVFGTGACSPGLVAALGCTAGGAIEGKLAGEAVWSASIFNQLENALGISSAVLTAASDWQLGNTDVDAVTGELLVGENTVRGTATALLGFIPSSDIDLAVNIVQVDWDLNGNPGQLRLGRAFPWVRWRSP